MKQIKNIVLTGLLLSAATASFAGNGPYRIGDSHAYQEPNSQWTTASVQGKTRDDVKSELLQARNDGIVNRNYNTSAYPEAWKKVDSYSPVVNH